MKKKSASALTFFNPGVLTAHRKQSRTRPIRMPASLGMLLRAAGLLAVPRKAFSRGQGMNRPIAVICLRRLVGLLSAVVVAILLFASNHADAQSQPAPMIGIFYLENSDAAGNPPYNWAMDQGLTTNTQTQMTFTGIISIKACSWRPNMEKKFPLVYRPGWRLHSGYMTLVRLLSM
jgi:hypothetical protein